MPLKKSGDLSAGEQRLRRYNREKYKREGRHGMRTAAATDAIRQGQLRYSN
jgi:hypothetical protein